MSMVGPKSTMFAAAVARTTLWTRTLSSGVITVATAFFTRRESEDSSSTRLAEMTIN